MKSYETIVTEDRRLAILMLLSETEGYERGDYPLQDVLDAFGHKVSIDRLRQDFAWLQEQSLITVRDIGGVQVAKLLGRGLDVAQGRAIVPGVKRPRPE